ncbi:MAG TPA: hypothetical protein VIU11_04605 [Nakamurella sp.]
MTERPRSRAEVRPTKERVEDQLLALPGVTGVDINHKMTGGRDTGVLSIVVYVDEKKPKGEIPAGQEVPAEIDGIPTDVQQETVELQNSFLSVLDITPQVDTTKYPTIHGGISMGPCRSIFLQPPDVPAPGNYVFTGTLGAVVKDRASGAQMALTNFHVACVDSGWAAGNPMAQPSLVDGGSCPADRFGTLTRAVLNEGVDCAAVTIDPSRTVECTIEQIGDVRGTIGATIGVAVRKRGRTTGFTHGRVDSVDATVSIPYGDGLGTVTLRHQIRVVPDTAQNARFSDRGDSGSVVVDADNRVLGLLFGGTTSGSATFLNPIQPVLDALSVDLCVKPVLVLTKPVVCQPLITHRIVCQSTPIICNVITKTPALCGVLTAPVVCRPPITAQCPPISLACGPVVQPPGPVGDLGPEGVEGPSASYGRADANSVDDAFWLGYYTALEALSEAGDEADGAGGA